MKNNTCYSNEWLEFLSEIENAQKELKLNQNEECFFRGHSDEKYKLQPGLFRGVKRTKHKIPDELWEIEYAMFYEFRARAKMVHDFNLLDWDVLFYMQHHKCRTRLLDWSENFGAALYFALLGKKNPNFSPTIWLLNPYRLNELYQNDRDLYSPEYLNTVKKDHHITYSAILNKDCHFWWDEPLALYPLRRVDRLTSQGGYFTIHGNNILPLEVIAKSETDLLRKILLPLSAINDAEKFLKLFGINDFTMFPDLDGLSSYLNRKYF